MVILYLTDVEWDDGNREKCCKHGVSIEEIEEVLTGHQAHIIGDEKHSELEERYIAVGKTDAERYLFVVFTYRSEKGAVFIRPLSARYMHAKEIAQYDQETT